MIRKVKKIGDPVLRKRANKVDKITKDIHKLIDDMVETMHHHMGIGLAAPQIGISQRIAVVALESVKMCRAAASFTPSLTPKS